MVCHVFVMHSCYKIFHQRFYLPSHRTTPIKTQPQSSPSLYQAGIRSPPSGYSSCRSPLRKSLIWLAAASSAAAAGARLGQRPYGVRVAAAAASARCFSRCSR
jgi:hypothetical protein